MSRHRWTPAPADVVLELLRAQRLTYRCHPERDGIWTAQCPVCGERRLTVHEHGRGGRVSFQCCYGCHADAIKHRLTHPAVCYECRTPYGQAEELARLADEASDIARASVALVREQLAVGVELTAAAA